VWLSSRYAATIVSTFPYHLPTANEVTNVLKSSIDEKKERETLKEKRDQLFALLVRNPQDTGLAVEIKLIDDQIAECTKQMKRNSKGSM
jgi:hypothetical protein